MIRWQQLIQSHKFISNNILPPKNFVLNALDISLSCFVCNHVFNAPKKSSKSRLHNSYLPVSGSDSDSAYEGDKSKEKKSIDSGSQSHKRHSLQSVSDSRSSRKHALRRREKPFLAAGRGKRVRGSHRGDLSQRGTGPTTHQSRAFQATQVRRLSVLRRHAPLSETQGHLRLAVLHHQSASTRRRNPRRHPARQPNPRFLPCQWTRIYTL